MSTKREKMEMGQGWKSSRLLIMMFNPLTNYNLYSHQPEMLFSKYNFKDQNIVILFIDISGHGGKGE